MVHFSTNCESDMRRYFQYGVDLAAWERMATPASQPSRESQFMVHGLITTAGLVLPAAGQYIFID